MSQVLGRCSFAFWVSASNRETRLNPGLPGGPGSGAPCFLLYPREARELCLSPGRAKGRSGQRDYSGGRQAGPTSERERLSRLPVFTVTYPAVSSEGLPQVQLSWLPPASPHSQALSALRTRACTCRAVYKRRESGLVKPRFRPLRVCQSRRLAGLLGRWEAQPGLRLSILTVIQRPGRFADPHINPPGAS